MHADVLLFCNGNAKDLVAKPTKVELSRVEFCSYCVWKRTIGFLLRISKNCCAYLLYETALAPVIRLKHLQTLKYATLSLIKELQVLLVSCNHTQIEKLLWWQLQTFFCLSYTHNVFWRNYHQSFSLNPSPLALQCGEWHWRGSWGVRSQQEESAGYFYAVCVSFGVLLWKYVHNVPLLILWLSGQCGQFHDKLLPFPMLSTTMLQFHISMLWQKNKK